MVTTHARKTMAQILVVIGWFLVVFGCLTIGPVGEKVARSTAVTNFLVDPSENTLPPFLGHMIGVSILTSPGALLGLAAWSLADLRSGKFLARVGLGVVVFALVFHLMP